MIMCDFCDCVIINSFYPSILNSYCWKPFHNMNMSKITTKKENPRTRNMKTKKKKTIKNNGNSLIEASYLISETKS